MSFDDESWSLGGHRPVQEWDWGASPKPPVITRPKLDPEVRRQNRRVRYKAAIDRRKRERVWENGRWVHPAVEHGKTMSYTDFGCRCELCTEAARNLSAKTKEGRRARTAANGGVAPTPRHGLNTYTNWGCRCAVCRAEMREYQRQRGASGAEVPEREEAS